MTWTQRIAVFDTETTGVDPNEARIVTAFIGILDGDGEIERGTDWLADPGVEIPETASAVHGITTEMAREQGEPAPEVVAKIAASLDWIARHRLPLVVYNAPFDLTLVQAECRRYGINAPQLGPQVVDPLVIDKAVDRYRKGKRTLTDVAAVYGVELLDAHDAADDSVAAGRIALAIAARYPAEVDIAIEELHAKQANWADESASSYEEWARRNGKPDFTVERGWPVRQS